MSSFPGNEKYASEDTVNKYFTDKVDSMLTRMQSLGSYSFVYKQLQQFIVYF